jgi:hypothetical protein
MILQFKLEEEYYMEQVFAKQREVQEELER